MCWPGRMNGPPLATIGAQVQHGSKRLNRDFRRLKLRLETGRDWHDIANAIDTAMAKPHEHQPPDYRGWRHGADKSAHLWSELTPQDHAAIQHFVSAG